MSASSQARAMLLNDWAASSRVFCRLFWTVNKYVIRLKWILFVLRILHHASDKESPLDLSFTAPCVLTITDVAIVDVKEGRFPIRYTLYTRELFSSWAWFMIYFLNTIYTCYARPSSLRTALYILNMCLMWTHLHLHMQACILTQLPTVVQ